MFKKVSLKAKLIVAAVITIFAFPQKINASNIEEEWKYHYLEFQGEEEYWRTRSISEDEPFFYAEEKAFRLFEAFFSEGLAPSIPDGTRLLQVEIDDELLILNVSEEVKNYGGTSNEQTLIRQLVKTAVSIPGVNKVTLLIEGEPDYLPEGSCIEEYEFGSFCIQSES